jgi:acyl transferase domain-containing protein/NAD(P)H-dependent flavin oxidoreductase YrpB (nitropropane dioxygenase family)/acyl carrier protein
MNKPFPNLADPSTAFQAAPWTPIDNDTNAAWQFRTLAITPFERPDLALARALWRQNCAVAVDIGRDPALWPELLGALARDPVRSGLGLRVPDGVALTGLVLPHAVQFLVAGGLDFAGWPDSWKALPILSQVCSVEEAAQALDCGAAGLIAKGQEAGGRVGDESSFVLLQRLVALTLDRAYPGAAPDPVWCQGGIGLNTASGALAGGAFGVVLDSVLAAYPESSLPSDLKAQILAMDGSEVQQAGGYQVYARGRRDLEAQASLTVEQVRAAIAAGELLPTGQDAALSALVLAECPTIETLLQTLRLRSVAQIRQAQRLRVLDEGNPWAQSHGTRYPIAQGPMTRVSDTAAFSVSVATGGGLPFLALSLMQEPACRKLLEATKSEIGSLPWGVGVLGFAPPEILNPQLELVKQFKPSALILAGGRPSQARPFVEMGIPTYLHVPSPGLLDIFLKDGGTHFVFEGRECGGHVGPRYSFVLWEQALALLMQVERPETLHILFAGGIHGARSGAMVAAIAAPLAARGAKVGVLMGTAYIATEEAVTGGAVLDEFQKKSLTGEKTVLVETAPGHAIRCLPSGFMDLFQREKARLKAEGIDQKEAWKALEALTVGRLRIATKGLDYVDGKLSTVDLARQEAEGMYMIGQIIALRRQVVTIAALHEDVSRGATALLEAIEPPALPKAAGAAPVAIIGMACLYPGSPDLEAYWANIVAGRDLVSEVPPERWNVDHYYDRGVAAPGKSVSKWGGFIDDTPFDPLKFGIPPQSLAAIEPCQLLSLAIASDALKDAGYQSRWFDREKTAVIFGAESSMDLASQYTFRNLYPQYCGELPPALDAALPSLTEDSFPGILVNVISGRIANRLGLGGVNYSVDSACASSLTAIELGVKELRAGSSEMVLAGGADFHNGIVDFLMFTSAGALSPSGRCRSFDDSADGICLGEGVGIVVLKRLDAAERDGDRIYAVIDGVAGSSDGKGLGLTAPRKEGQKRALERTYWQAGILPAEIGLVEAHGTGTVVGDRTELKTLTEVYVAGGAVPAQTGLGSVKSQIGHTKCAAGIAGLIKVAKALHHRVLPPTNHITSPNGWHRQDSSPFQFNALPAPWAAKTGPARAAVSAFGFGGTNFHAVLSAYPAHQTQLGAGQFPAELFVIRGETQEAADAVLRKVSAYLAGSTARVALRDVARAAWEAGAGPVQVAFVAARLGEAADKSGAALARRNEAGIQYRAPEPAGKIACLFAGQGSQYPGMLRDLFVHFPFLQAMPAAAAYLPVIYPPSLYDDAAKAKAQRHLTDTRNAQPSLGLVELAAFEWLQGLGLTPDMAAGHSYGELAALAAAGAFDSDTLAALSRARGEAMLASAGEDSGSMAAVRLDVEALRPLLADFPTVVMANQNSPMQTVISGPTADVAAACAFLSKNAVSARKIDTDCAFHSPLMAAAEQAYADMLTGHQVGSLNWPVYSNITAAPHEDDAATIRGSLARHIVSPVRFVAEIERMYADGARLFLEIGPRKVLTGLVTKILKGKPHTALAIDPEESGFAGLLGVVAQLAVRLSQFDATALFAGRTDAIDLDKPAKLPVTTWMVNGGRAWPLNGQAPAHGAAVVLKPVVDLTTAPAPVAAPVVDAGDGALVGYLTNMREMVQAQRDVLLGYFGAPQAPRPIVSAPRPAPVQKQIAPPPVAQPARPDTRHVLLEIVAERTGYPPEMLDLDLDLEADLSIDSIKRLEIIGELSQRLAFRSVLGADADALLEQLAAQKTLRAVITWLDGKLPAAQAAPVATVAPVSKTPDTRQVLLEIVAERTGYPPEMLDLDLDLEADLSIDSIKRLEIIGELAQRLDFRGAIGANADALLEQLAAQKTLRAVLAWLDDKLPKSAPVVEPSAPVAAPRVQMGPLLLDIVSQCTGYPVEALDLDLDLEADLSIDSIKRLEIVGQLSERMSIADTADKDAMLERLAQLKTLRAMIGWLEQRDAPAEAPVTVAVEDPTAIPLERYVLRSRLLPPAKRGSVSLSGKYFLITDDARGLAQHVAALLHTHGAATRIIPFPGDATDDLVQADGLIHLGSLIPEGRVRYVKHLFGVMREALLTKTKHLLVASGLGGRFGFVGAGSDFRHGGGLAGLIKAVGKEFPDVRAKLVDFDLSEPLDRIATYIEQELLSEELLPEIAYHEGRRHACEAVPSVLNGGSLDGLPLDEQSVVLLTGGARGITALIAVALAKRYRCKIELVGRSPLPPDQEDPLTQGVEDPRRLRQILLTADPNRRPADVERLVQRLLADRDVRKNLAAIRAAGSVINYTSLDVRDIELFADFILALYERYGRIDGVIHGAGIVEDKLVRDKTEESFNRVFDTKVRGAMSLHAFIRDDVKFVVFFSSVASAFGNRGQADYASANDVLDKLAHSWQARIPGRILSVNWGPWADTGMVSDSLKKEYERKGIGLIPQEEGVKALLLELSSAGTETQVVLMCGKPVSFGGIEFGA